MAEGRSNSSWMRNNFDNKDQKENLSKEKKVEEVKKEEKIVNQAPETAFPDLPDNRASRQSSLGSANTLAFMARHEELNNTDLKKALNAPALTPFWSQDEESITVAADENQPNQPQPDTSETSQTSDQVEEVSCIVSSYVRCHRSLSSTQAALSTAPASEQTPHSQGNVSTNISSGQEAAAPKPASLAGGSGSDGSNPTVSSTSPPEQTLPNSATGGTNNLNAGHAPTPSQPPFIPYPAGVYPSVMVPLSYYPLPVYSYPHYPPALSFQGTPTMDPFSGTMGFSCPVGQPMMPNIQQPNIRQASMPGSGLTAMPSNAACRATFESRNVQQNIQQGQTASVPSSEENSRSDSPPRSYSNDTRLTHLPKPVIDWLRKKLDQNTRNNWEILATARGYNYREINDHDEECYRYRKSPFLELLNTEKFITYTIGDLLKDIKDIRKDIVIDFQSVLENNKHGK